MRLVGKVASRELAMRFEDYLMSLGIGSQVREQGDGFAVWVLDEDAVARAETEFAAFAVCPGEARFAVARAPAAAPASPAADAGSASREVAMPRTWAGVPSLWDTPVILALIAASVALTLWAQFGEDGGVAGALMMSSRVMQGESWRLVTPIFLHFGALHLVFNLLWLRQLGGMVEWIRGRLHAGVLVMALAVVSNVAQYLAVGGGFGGMSGVVYGLFGYVWIKSRREPWSGFVIEPQTVWLMLAWFVLCFTGWLGPVANIAHGGGLLAGVLAGLVPSARARA